MSACSEHPAFTKAVAKVICSGLREVPGDQLVLGVWHVWHVVDDPRANTGAQAEGIGFSVADSVPG